MSREPLLGTWMVDMRRRAQLHELINQRLVLHLQTQKELQSPVAPQSVMALCGDLEGATQARLWFLGTCVCALLAELLYGSESGGIFLSDEHSKRERKAWRKRPQGIRWTEELSIGSVKQCLYYLRNTCFHPAHVRADAGHGELHVENLAWALQGRGDAKSARQLRRSYSFLRDFELYKVAVRMIDELGKEFLDARVPPTPAR